MGYALKSSSTAKPLIFLLVQSSDHITGLTGASPTVTLSKNGASFASPSGAVTEIGSGWYKVAGNATDTNTVGPLALHATAASADPVDDTFTVVAYDPDDATALGISRLDAAVSTRMATFTLPTNFSSLAITGGGAVTAGTVSDKTGYSLSVTPPTAAQVATAVWQDTTAGDFTVASSIGKSLFTSGNAPGAANGLALVGSNVTFASGTDFSSTMKTSLSAATPTASLSAAAIAAIAQSVYGQTVYYVTTTGNDANAGTSPLAPFLTVAHAAATVTGPAMILVGGGTFNEGTNVTTLAADVSLVGSGMDTTTIVSTASLSTAGQGCAVKPGDRSTVANLTITVNSSNAAPIGYTTLGATQTPFVNAVFRNLKLSGGADGLYVRASTGQVCSYIAYNCVVNSNFDCFTTFGAGTVTADLYNCTLSSSSAGSNNSRGIVNSAATGNVRMFGGQIKVNNNSNSTVGAAALTTSASGFVELYSVEIQSLGDANEFDFSNTGSSLSEFDCTYDPTKVSGSITKIKDRYVGGVDGVTFPATVASPTNITAASGITLAASQHVIADSVVAPVNTTTVITSGTAQAGASASITLASGASVFANNYLKGSLVILTGGTGAGQFRIITSYNSGTQVASVVSSWTTNPDATTTYAIVPAAVDVQTWVYNTTNQLDNGNLPANVLEWHSTAVVAMDTSTGQNLPKVFVPNSAIGVTQNYANAGSVGSVVNPVTTTYPIKRNSAFPAFQFVMFATGTNIPTAGLTVSGQVSFGGAFTNLTNAVSEVGSGLYKVDLAAADTNATEVTYKFTATGADATMISVPTQS